VSRFIGKRRAAGLAAIMVACIAGVSAYAFTASNTVPAHIAGAGSAVVSAFTVTGPTNYTFSADGTTVTALSFQLNAAATDVATALSAAAPVNADWVDCGASAGVAHDVTCTFATPVANGAALQLTIAAVSTGTVTIAP
jgi:hypothetical protein